jgi:paraquat-inducible protein B
VIGEVDKTTKELGFTPAVLDACIDNSAKVLINVNRYSAGLQTSSKAFSKFFDGMSKSLAAQGDRNSASLLNQLSGHLKTFVTANKFIQTGSQIMSRMVYTMLKNARVVNDGKQDAIDAESVTFGRLLLGNSN